MKLHGYNTKLNEEVVKEIRRLLKDGVKGKDIAKKFNVSPSNISAIKNNKIWNLTG